VVERAVAPESPAAPRVVLIVILAALAGALAAAVYAIVREGPAQAQAPAPAPVERHEDTSFDLERFLDEPANGGPVGGLEVDRWLSDAASRERA